MPKRSKANRDTEAAEPKRRSDRLQAKPQTPKSESKPKNAPRNPKRVKGAGKGQHEEKVETENVPATEAPAKNGDVNAGKETSAEAEDDQEKKEKKNRIME